MKMFFGKHKGEELDTIPKDYLRYLLIKTKTPPFLYHAIIDTLSQKHGFRKDILQAKYPLKTTTKKEQQ